MVTALSLGASVSLLRWPAHYSCARQIICRGTAYNMPMCKRVRIHMGSPLGEIAAESEVIMADKKLLLCNYRQCDTWGICPHAKPHPEIQECKRYNCNSQGQCAKCLPLAKESAATVA